MSLLCVFFCRYLELTRKQHIHWPFSIHYVWWKLTQMKLWSRTANTSAQCIGSDTLESFLSKAAFESNSQKKLARTEHVLIVKVSFERRKIAKVFMTHVQDFFRKWLSKDNFLVCHYLMNNNVLDNTNIFGAMHMHSTIYALYTKCPALCHKLVFYQNNWLCHHAIWQTMDS